MCVYRKDPLSNDSCWLYTEKKFIFIFFSNYMPICLSIVWNKKILNKKKEMLKALKVTDFCIVFRFIACRLFLIFSSSSSLLSNEISRERHLASHSLPAVPYVPLAIHTEIKETPKSHYHRFCIALGQWNNVFFFLRENVHERFSRESL